MPQNSVTHVGTLQTSLIGIKTPAISLPFDNGVSTLQFCDPAYYSPNVRTLATINPQVDCSDNERHCNGTYFYSHGSKPA